MSDPPILGDCFKTQGKFAERVGGRGGKAVGGKQKHGAGRAKT
jgi:hypothetical protein